jgi:predicted amidohydrolase YtcJ
MVAAIGRQTLAGKALGLSERVAASTALCLYLADAASPGGPTRRVAVGAAADLCLLDAPLDAVLMAPCASRVRATIIDGRLRYLNAAAPAMS